MTAVEADFYDTDIQNPESLAMRPLWESPWLPLYLEVAGWIENDKPIVELGCGTGRFAALLAERRHNADYQGIDFSPLAIDAARDQGTGFEFEVGDLRDWAPEEHISGDTVFVCLETLEHLDNDKALIARIPPGHRLILSVPNFDSKAHVRHFTSPAQIWQRYQPLLLFRRWSYIDYADGRPGRAIHLVETVRRSESWDA